MRYDLQARASAAAGTLRAASRHIVYRAAAAAILAVVLIVAGVLWGYWSNLYKDVQARIKRLRGELTGTGPAGT